MAKPDLSEFKALSRPKGAPCFMRRILDRDSDMEVKLTKAEVEQLDAALETDKGIITGAAIRAWLAARGIRASAMQVTVHRNRTCSCGRP